MHVQATGEVQEGPCGRETSCRAVAGLCRVSASVQHLEALVDALIARPRPVAPCLLACLENNVQRAEA